MEYNKKIVTTLVALLLVLGIVVAVMFIRDDKESVIERKTTFSVPSYCTIEDYRAYGSMFNRSGFEAKIRIDNVQHMNELILKMNTLLGDDYHEISLAEYNITKYDLFQKEKLIPNPSSVSWVIVGPITRGSLVIFMCIENTADYYMYMYYVE